MGIPYCIILCNISLNRDATNYQIISSLYSNNCSESRYKDIQIDILIQDYPVGSTNLFGDIYIRRDIYNLEEKISKNLLQSVEIYKFKIVKIFFGKESHGYNYILLNLKYCLSS